MADQDDENDETDVDVAPGVVLRSDQMNFTQPDAGGNPFANLVRGRAPGRLGEPRTNQQAVEQARPRQESERPAAAEPMPAARRQGTGQLPPRLPRRVPRWKTGNEVRRWDRRLDA